MSGERGRCWVNQVGLAGSMGDVLLPLQDLSLSSRRARAPVGKSGEEKSLEGKERIKKCKQK